MLKRLLAGFLIIGDSHTVGPFGSQLQSKLLQSLSSSTEVERYAVAGSATQHWLKDQFCESSNCSFKMGYVVKQDPIHSETLPLKFPNAQSLISSNQKKNLIIALGTNDANILCHNKNLDKFDSDVRRLISYRNKETSCFWVGPPRYEVGPVANNCGSSYDTFVDHLKKTVRSSDCVFIDSREIKLPSGQYLQADAKDKTHFGISSGKAWAEQVLNQINSAMNESKVRQNHSSNSKTKSPSENQ